MKTLFAAVVAVLISSSFIRIPAADDLNQQLINRQHERNLLHRLNSNWSNNGKDPNLASAAAASPAVTSSSDENCESVSFEVAFRDTTEVADNFEYLKNSLIEVMITLKNSATLYIILLSIIILMLAILLVFHYSDVTTKQSKSDNLVALESVVKIDSEVAGHGSAEAAAPSAGESSPSRNHDNLYAIHEGCSPNGSRQDREAQYIEKCSSIFTETVKRKGSVSLFRTAGSGGESIISPERTYVDAIPTQSTNSSSKDSIASVSTTTPVRRVLLQEFSYNPLVTRSPTRNSNKIVGKTTPTRVALRPLSAVLSSSANHKPSASEKGPSVHFSNPHQKSSSRKLSPTGDVNIQLQRDKASIERKHAEAMKLLNQQLDEAQDVLTERNNAIGKLEKDLSILRKAQANALTDIKQQLQEQRQEMHAMRETMKQQEVANASFVMDFAALGAEWMKSLEDMDTPAVSSVSNEIHSSDDSMDLIDQYLATITKHNHQA